MMAWTKTEAAEGEKNSQMEVTSTGLADGLDVGRCEEERSVKNIWPLPPPIMAILFQAFKMVM